MFAETIKKLLKEQNKTQSDLALFAGVKPNTVSDWLKKGTSPKLEHLYRISEFFSVSFDFLFTENSGNKSLIGDDNIILEKYHLLDERGQTMVKATLYTEMDRMERNELLLSSQRPPKAFTDEEPASLPKDPPLALKIRKPLGKPNGYDSQLEQAL